MTEKEDQPPIEVEALVGNMDDVQLIPGVDEESGERGVALRFSLVGEDGTLRAIEGHMSWDLASRIGEGLVREAKIHTALAH